MLRIFKSAAVLCLAQISLAAASSTNNTANLIGSLANTVVRDAVVPVIQQGKAPVVESVLNGTEVVKTVTKAAESVTNSTDTLPASTGDKNDTQPLITLPTTVVKDAIDVIPTSILPKIEAGSIDAPILGPSSRPIVTRAPTRVPVTTASPTTSEIAPSEDTPTTPAPTVITFPPRTTNAPTTTIPAPAPSDEVPTPPSRTEPPETTKAPTTTAPAPTTAVPTVPAVIFQPSQVPPSINGKFFPEKLTAEAGRIPSFMMASINSLRVMDNSDASSAGTSSFVSLGSFSGYFEFQAMDTFARKKLSITLSVNQKVDWAEGNLEWKMYNWNRKLWMSVQQIAASSNEQGHWRQYTWTIEGTGFVSPGNTMQLGVITPTSATDNMAIDYLEADVRIVPE